MIMSTKSTYVEHPTRAVIVAVTLVLSLSVFCPSTSAAAEKVFEMADGSTYVGVVMDEGESGYLIRSGDGRTLRLPYADIVNIITLDTDDASEAGADDRPSTSAPTEPASRAEAEASESYRPPNPPRLETGLTRDQRRQLEALESSADRKRGAAAGFMVTGLVTASIGAAATAIAQRDGGMSPVYPIVMGVGFVLLIPAIGFVVSAERVERDIVEFEARVSAATFSMTLRF